MKIKLGTAIMIFALVACGGGGGMNYNNETAASTPTTTSGTNTMQTTSATATTTSNSAPTINDLPMTMQVNENQTQIGDVDATDSDGDELGYMLGGADADLLQISPTGALSFRDAPDYETKSSYTVTVSVSDGTDTTTQNLTINITDVAETVSQAPVELVVIIQSVSDGYSSSNKYSVDGEIAPTITLEKGKTYRFLQSDASNSNHPVRFSLTSNGTHNNGTEFSDNVSFVGQPGSIGAYTQIQIPSDSNLTTLYYYCSNHSGMGGAITISTENSSGYGITPRSY